MEPILSLILVIAVIGFVVWLLITLIPMPAPFPNVIIGFACLLVLLFVLGALGGGIGLFHGGSLFHCS